MPRRPIQVEIAPAVLRWARETTGLTSSQVAARLGITEARVAGWEEGSDSPTLTDLERLPQRSESNLVETVVTVSPFDWAPIAAQVREEFAKMKWPPGIVNPEGKGA